MTKKQNKKPNFKKITTSELKAIFDPTWPDETKYQWQSELFMRKESLDERYYRYLEPSELMGFVLKHPMYVGYCDPSRAALINFLIEQRQKTTDTLAAQKMWHEVVIMHPVPFLLDAFNKYEKDFADKDYWKLLAYVWVHQEQLWPNRKTFLRLFQSSRPERRWLMTAAERRKIESLPDEFTVYRGFIGKRGKGLSWTIDKKKADWFAKRFAVIEELGKPKLMEGIAKKKDVLAYFNGRKEKEIVIDPDKVTKVKILPVAFDPDEETGR